MAMADAYEGFGGSTPGGKGQPTYRVTNLKDSGAGSLRDAVSKGYRSIIFDVAGEIKLLSDVYVKGAYITVDGFTAPSPGITLRYHGLIIHGSTGAHDVIVRGIRVRDSQGCDTCSTSGAGFSISRDAYKVVLDGVSVSGAQDQALSVGKGARDITVQWSIFAESKGSSGSNLLVLISTNTRRVTMHHNLLIKAYERMPQVKWLDSGGKASETQLDFRNNIVWDWVYAGSQVWKGTKANLVNNYYHDPDAGTTGKKRAIYFCEADSTSPQCDGTNSQWYAQAYIAGNVSGHGSEITAYLNSLGTESKPFSAASVSTSSACTAAKDVLAKAGVRPLDSVDQKYVNLVKLASCS
jgi:pectate lyase